MTSREPVGLSDRSETTLVQGNGSRVLLGIVVVMGVMIVVGVAGIIGVIVHRMAHGSARDANVAALGHVEDAGRNLGTEVSLPVPAGSRILSYRTAQNGTVVVHIRGADTDCLIMWNPLTGRVIGGLTLASPAPDKISP